MLLQSTDPQNSEVLKVELAGIQSMLGIEAGGADALVALSLLCGGDYAVKGAEHVGSRQAIRLVRHLLEGCQVVSCFNSACSHVVAPEHGISSAPSWHQAHTVAVKTVSRGLGHHFDDYSSSLCMIANMSSAKPHMSNCRQLVCALKCIFLVSNSWEYVHACIQHVPHAIMKQPSSCILYRMMRKSWTI